jgi:hypothetical protein
LQLPSLPVGISCSSRAASALVAQLFEHLVVALCRCAEEVVLLEDSGRIGVALSGKEPIWRSWDQAAPLLKIAMTDLALSCADNLIIHAALLSQDDDGLLLVGPPAAGKSTLAVALTANGFHLEGDDIASPQSDGRIQALPFPATVKDGAVPLLESSHPGIVDLPRFVRPDGQNVRYLKPTTVGTPPPRRVKCVLCLERNEVQSPDLVRLRIEEAIGALIGGAWCKEERLSSHQFEAIFSSVDDVDCYRLSYANLRDGVRLAQSAWNNSRARPNELAI